MASSTTDIEMKPVDVEQKPVDDAEQKPVDDAEQTPVEEAGSSSEGESSSEQKSQGSLKPGFRRYNLLDLVEDGPVDGPPKFKLTKRVFTARTPHAAAKKVANRGLTVIYLQEVNTKGKGLVHHFHGTKRPLQGKEITEYSKKIGANHKAIVKKQGTIRIVKKGSRKNKISSGPEKKIKKGAAAKKVAAAKKNASSKKVAKKSAAAPKKDASSKKVAKKSAPVEKAPAAAKKASAAVKKAPATKRGKAAAEKAPVAIAAK